MADPLGGTLRLGREVVASGTPIVMVEYSSGQNGIDRGGRIRPVQARLGPTPVRGSFRAGRPGERVGMAGIIVRGVIFRFVVWQALRRFVTPLFLLYV